MECHSQMGFIRATLLTLSFALYRRVRLEDEAPNPKPALTSQIIQEAQSTAKRATLRHNISLRSTVPKSTACVILDEYDLDKPIEESPIESIRDLVERIEYNSVLDVPVVPVTSSETEPLNVRTSSRLEERRKQEDGKNRKKRQKPMPQRFDASSVEALSISEDIQEKDPITESTSAPISIPPLLLKTDTFIKRKRKSEFPAKIMSPLKMRIKVDEEGNSHPVVMSTTTSSPCTPIITITDIDLNDRTPSKDVKPTKKRTEKRIDPLVIALQNIKNHRSPKKQRQVRLDTSGDSKSGSKPAPSIEDHGMDQSRDNLELVGKPEVREYESLSNLFDREVCGDDSSQSSTDIKCNDVDMLGMESNKGSSDLPVDKIGLEADDGKVSLKPTIRVHNTRYKGTKSVVNVLKRKTRNKEKSNLKNSNTQEESPQKQMIENITCLIDTASSNKNSPRKDNNISVTIKNVSSKHDSPRNSDNIGDSPSGRSIARSTAIQEQKPTLVFKTINDSPSKNRVTRTLRLDDPVGTSSKDDQIERKPKIAITIAGHSTSSFFKGQHEIDRPKFSKVGMEGGPINVSSKFENRTCKSEPGQNEVLGALKGIKGNFLKQEIIANIQLKRDSNEARLSTKSLNLRDNITEPDEFSSASQLSPLKTSLQNITLQQSTLLDSHTDKKSVKHASLERDKISPISRTLSSNLPPTLDRTLTFIEKPVHLIVSKEAYTEMEREQTEGTKGKECTIASALGENLGGSDIENSTVGVQCALTDKHSKDGPGRRNSKNEPMKRTSPKSKDTGNKNFEIRGEAPRLEKSEKYVKKSIKARKMDMVPTSPHRRLRQRKKAVERAVKGDSGTLAIKAPQNHSFPDFGKNALVKNPSLSCQPSVSVKDLSESLRCKDSEPFILNSLGSPDDANSTSEGSLKSVDPSILSNAMDTDYRKSTTVIVTANTGNSFNKEAKIQSNKDRTSTPEKEEIGSKNHGTRNSSSVEKKSRISDPSMDVISSNTSCTHSDNLTVALHNASNNTSSISRVGYAEHHPCQVSQSPKRVGGGIPPAAKLVMESKASTSESLTEPHTSGNEKGVQCTIQTDSTLQQSHDTDSRFSDNRSHHMISTTSPLSVSDRSEPLSEVKTYARNSESHKAKRKKPNRQKYVALKSFNLRSKRSQSTHRLNTSNKTVFFKKGSKVVGALQSPAVVMRDLATSFRPGEDINLEVLNKSQNSPEPRDMLPETQETKSSKTTEQTCKRSPQANVESEGEGSTESNTRLLVEDRAPLSNESSTVTATSGSALGDKNRAQGPLSINVTTVVPSTSTSSLLLDTLSKIRKLKSSNKPAEVKIIKSVSTPSRNEPIWGRKRLVLPMTYDATKLVNAMNPETSVSFPSVAVQMLQNRFTTQQSSSSPQKESELAKVSNLIQFSVSSMCSTTDSHHRHGGIPSKATAKSAQQVSRGAKPGPAIEVSALSENQDLSTPSMVVTRKKVIQRSWLNKRSKRHEGHPCTSKNQDGHDRSVPHDDRTDSSVDRSEKRPTVIAQKVLTTQDTYRMNSAPIPTLITGSLVSKPLQRSAPPGSQLKTTPEKEPRSVQLKTSATPVRTHGHTDDDIIDLTCHETVSVSPEEFADALRKNLDDSRKTPDTPLRVPAAVIPAREPLSPPNRQADKDTGHRSTCRAKPTSPSKPGKMVTGDIVWGKVYGHPWWPGRILKVNKILDTVTETQEVHVAWFGSRTQSTISTRVLVPFAENFKAKFIRMKKGPYRVAVNEARAACNLQDKH